MGHLPGPRINIWRRPSSWAALCQSWSGALAEAGARHQVLPAGASCHTKRGQGEWSLARAPSRRLQKVYWVEGMPGPHTQLVVEANGDPRDKWLPGTCLENQGLFWSPPSKEQSPGYSCVCLSFCWLIFRTGMVSLSQNIAKQQCPYKDTVVWLSSDLMKSSESLKACLWQSKACSVKEKPFQF